MTPTTYIIGTWTERYGSDFNGGGQIEHIYCASGPGVPEFCFPDRIISPLRDMHDSMRNRWLQAWRTPDVAVLGWSATETNPWTVTLSAPVFGYPYTLDGDPLPGDVPVGGVGGPWQGGTGSTGPDGSPAIPPPSPAAQGNCSGTVYLSLSGLPITTRVRAPSWATNGHLIPGCNGMQARARLWELSYPGNATNTGIDYSQPPTRSESSLPDPLPDGQIIWSGTGGGRIYELEALSITVDGQTYTPAQRYHRFGTGCAEAGLPVTYVPQPTPGLLLDPVRVELTPDAGSLTYPPHAPLTVGSAYRIGVQTSPAHAVQTLWVTSSEAADAGLTAYRTETLLARLARLTPWPTGLTLSGPWPSATAALTALLTALRELDGWSWFGWEDLPELCADGSAVPVQAITVPAGLTALELLRRVASPFPFTVQASRWGRLTLTPTTGAAQVLTDADVLTVTVGPLDTGGVVNACTIVSGGVATPYAPDSLPVEVALSRAAYGPRALVLDLPLVVTPADAERLAGQVVQARASPTRACSVTQGAPYPVTAEHVGRIVTLPEGRGVVTGWSYSEAHTPPQSQSSSTYVVSVTTYLSDLPQTLADGTTTIPSTEDRYDVAQWDAAPLTP